MISIGLAGAGQQSRAAWAPALAARPDVRFVGLWGRSADAAGALAAEHGVVAYRSFFELLAHCDGVAFALPPAVQADLAATAAMRGKAVLLSRPIAADRAGAEALAIAVDTSGRPSVVGLSWRFADAVREFLLVGAPRTDPQGASGRVVSGDLIPESSASPWRLERGVLHGAGSDLVDLHDAALGRVLGLEARGDLHGWVGLMLEHEGGRFSELSMTGTVARGVLRAEIEVFGPRGTAAIDSAQAVGPEVYETIVQEFADALAHDKPHEINVQRGLHLQELLESAETDLLRRS